MQTMNKKLSSSNDSLILIEVVNKNKKAFTLVELIIVITILAILATIWFISFQNYTKNSRDGNRLATITQIQKWLELFALKTTKYPNPDEIYGTGIYEPTNTILNYVWYVWGNIGGLININKIPLDPVTGDKYVYAVSSNHQKYQLATTLENLQTNTLIATTYANASQARVVGNYTYPLRLWNYLYSLPSLIFVGSGISSTGFVIDKGLNLPYTINNEIPNNFQTLTEQLEQLTWSSGLSLTGVEIPSNLTIEEYKNQTGIPEIFDALWMRDKDILWTAIFWKSYFSEKSVWSSSSSSSGGWENLPEEPMPILTYNSSATYNVWDTFIYTRWWDDYEFEVVLATSNGYVAYTNVWNDDINTLSPIDHIWLFWRNTANGTEIMMKTLNAWANTVWTNQTFVSATTPRNLTINAWAWWLYQWWNNADVSFTWAISWQISCTQTGSTYSNEIFRTWNSNWCTTQVDTMWWHGWSDEERRWPCEIWYRLPNSWIWWDWEKVYQIITWNTNSSCSSCWTQVTTLQNYLKLPWGGYRFWPGAAGIDDQGSYGNYWSSTPDSTNAYTFLFSSNYIHPSSNSARAHGLSVRCFKN